MSWETRLADPQTTSYFIVLIDGLPRIISSTELPAAFVAAGWTQDVSLDLSEGLKDPGQTMNRKGGVSSPTTISVRTEAPSSGGLRSWMMGGFVARTPLTSGVTFTAGTINVADTTPFASPAGVACLGNETFSYTGTTPTSFTGCVRGEYDSVAQETIIEPGFLSGTRYVTDRPLFLEGHRMRLIMGLANLSGQPLDQALGGTYQREVWAGIIDSVDEEANFIHLSVSGRTLACTLDSDAGGYPARGRLGYTGVDQAQGGLSWYTLMNGAYIPAGGETISMSVEDSAGIITPVTATIATGWTSVLAAHICVAVHAALVAALSPANPQYIMCWRVHLPPTWNSGGTEPWEVAIEINVKFFEPAQSYKLTWFVTPGDPLHKLGFDLGTYTPTDYSPGTNEAYKITTNKIPPMISVGPSDTEILFWSETGQYGEEFPPSGYAVLEAGSAKEVIYYGAIVSMGPDGFYQLNNVERGRMDTSPQSFVVETKEVVADKANNSPATAGDSPSVTAVLGFENEGLLTIILKLCMSTGTPGTRHATYDAADVQRGQGLGLPSAWFDIARFEEVEAELEKVVKERSILWTKPFKASTWIGKELAALGWSLLTRPTALGYKITLERLHSPLLVGRYSLAQADITPQPWPSRHRHRRSIANAVEMSLLWNVAEEKWEKVKVVIEDVDSQQDYRVRQVVKAEMKGLRNALGTATEVSQLYGPPLLALYSRMYSIVKLGCRRRAWLFHPGDQVTVSLGRIEQGATIPVWDAQTMIVAHAENKYAGDGVSSLSVLDLIHVDNRRLSYWSPSAEIDVYAGGPPPTITLKANAYSNATQTVPWTGEPAVDADFFADGMSVYVQKPGDESARVVRRLSNRVGNTYDLDAALPVAMWTGAVITFPDWSVANSWQEKFVYVGDNLFTLGAANDPAFQFSE